MRSTPDRGVGTPPPPPPPPPQNGSDRGSDMEVKNPPPPACHANPQKWIGTNPLKTAVCRRYCPGSPNLTKSFINLPA